MIIAACLHGCGWVDSTGTTNAENNSDSGISVPLVDFETSVKSLQEGQATALLENTASQIQLEGVGRSTNGWNWELVGAGDNASCNGVGGFDSSYAADSLEDACTPQSQCALQINEAAAPEEPDFIFTLPSLSAPVALTYIVSSEQEDGSAFKRDQIFCALAVNEAPNAGNDTYRALAGVPRTVRARDANDLLENDFDDLDIRNQPLRIDTRVVIAPQYAEDFSLQSDGGFSYTAASVTPLDNNGEQTDFFVYSVTDGLHEVNATVTISIVATNNDPLPIGTLPDVLIDLSILDEDAEYKVDVANYFRDADDDPLYYSIDTNDLPDGLTTSIDDEGLLTIYLDTSGSTQSSGDWQIDVFASDGLATAATDFQLTIVNTTPRTNSAPTVSDISNRFVQNTFEYDVSVFFSDPDGDELTFSSDRLPPDVTLSSSGVLSGTSSSQNSGVWFIVVKASDELGESVSDGFRLVIN